tara:strand:- start:499 stop:633 length:135 start_codon:yes stop_codon:yes gene_type:complete
MNTPKERLKEIIKLIKDLGWDYERFSSSGQETYDKIIELIIEKQ